MALVLSLLFTAAACQQPTAIQHTPELVGVVASVASGPGPQRVALEGGREIVILLSDYDVVTGSGLPRPADLLLSGSAPRPWVAGLSTAAAPEPSCFWLGGGGADKGGFIETDGGLRLAKASNFDSGTWRPDQGRYRSNGFCVNERGEVESVH